MYARQGIGTENEERERMNILVCDDDREIVEAIEIYLSQEGYHILKAYDGMQALKVMEQEEVHLLIIDVMMPKLDGIRATPVSYTHLNPEDEKLMREVIREYLT